MGTDIHMWLEAKNWDGRWRLQMGQDACYGNRNYDAFAVLANVRNGRGFAGVKTGEGFNVIAMPRGLPDDMSPELKVIMDAGIEHTPTWLLLSEVLNFDWTQVAHKQGWTEALSFAAWERKDPLHLKGPPSYCGDVSGPGVRHVSAEDMRSALSQASIPSDVLEYVAEHGWAPHGYKAPEEISGMYALVQWSETYESRCSDLLTWARGVRAKHTRFEDTKPEDIRLVFWFDS